MPEDAILFTLIDYKRLHMVNLVARMNILYLDVLLGFSILYIYIYIYIYIYMCVCINTIYIYIYIYIYTHIYMYIYIIYI